jgi:hypothetical protein
VSWWGWKLSLAASHIHIGCMQSVLAPWDAVDGHRVQVVGVDFRENGVWPSLYDVTVSWLRLQTPIDCISHLYWLYTKCFSTLRCCGWAYGYTLMPYYMCRWGWVLGKMGYGRTCVMLWSHCWGCKPPLTASHIHIGCKQSVLAPWDAWMGIWVHPYAIPLHVQVGVHFRGNEV